jgi:hypothetical protein
VLIWLTAEYTSLAVILDANDIKERRLTYKQQTEIINKRSRMWKVIAWLQFVYYIVTRLSYVIITTKCYWTETAQDCLNHATVINNSTTVVLCLSITAFMVTDLIKIRKCVVKKSSDSRQDIQSSFKLNEVTVGILVTLVVL